MPWTHLQCTQKSQWQWVVTFLLVCRNLPGKVKGCKEQQKKIKKYQGKKYIQKISAKKVFKLQKYQRKNILKKYISKISLQGCKKIGCKEQPKNKLQKYQGNNISKKYQKK